MLAAYRSVLSTPGAIAFTIPAFVGRVPIAMMSLAVIFVVEDATGSYSVAGTMSATLLVATSLAAPVHARLAERVGQGLVVRWAVVLHALGIACFVLLLQRTDVLAPAYVAAAVAGVGLPQLGAFVRRRWVHVAPSRAQVQTAYAWESVLDEVIFVTGPIVVTVLAVQLSPTAAILATAAFTTAGGLVYATRRSTEPGVVPAEERAAAAAVRMPWLRLGLLAASGAALGVTFGAIELSTVAHAEAIGRPGAAALVLATFAGGSLVAGLVAGARSWRWPTDVRYAVGLLALAVALVPPTNAAEPIVLAGLIAIAGMTVAPTLIAGYSLVAEVVPPLRLTEGLAYYQTALGLGVALGAAASGPIADAGRPLLGFAVAVAGAAVAGVLAGALSWQIRTTAPAGRHTG